MENRSIEGRNDFHAALREAFALAATQGCRELWLCDDTFADWPLGERAVVEHLTQWASSHRQLHLLARHFDEVARRHARFVEWRRAWSHIVHCRANTEIESGQFPTAFIGTGSFTLYLVEPAQWRGRFSTDVADAVRWRETIDAVLQRSEEAFPVTTTGL